jgi:hypothetical protein
MLQFMKHMLAACGQETAVALGIPSDANLFSSQLRNLRQTGFSKAQSSASGFPRLGAAQFTYFTI